MSTTKEGTARAGTLRLCAVWPDFGVGYVEVTDESDALGTFYVRITDSGGLVYSFREVEIGDGYGRPEDSPLPQLINPTEWETEFGGLCSYEDLRSAVEEALK